MWPTRDKSPNLQTVHVAQYQKNSTATWVEDLNRHLSKEDTQITKRNMQRCSTLLIIQFSSVAQSCLTLCDPMNCTRPPCPSPSPGVHSNSRLSLISHASSGKQLILSLPQFLYSLNGMVWNGMLSRVRLFAIPWTVALQAPLSRWCHPAISSSVVPLSSCPQSLPASESFSMSQLFTWGGQSTGVSALTSFLPKNTQGWSPLEWTGWISLQSKGQSLLSYKKEWSSDL